MLLYSEKALDRTCVGTTLEVSPPELWESLARATDFYLQARVTNVTGAAGSLITLLMYSNDGLTWTSTSGPGGAVSLATTSYFYGTVTSLTAKFVRVYAAFNSSATSGRVEVWVAGRAKAAGRSRVETTAMRASVFTSASAARTPAGMPEPLTPRKAAAKPCCDKCAKPGETPCGAKVGFPLAAAAQGLPLQPTRPVDAGRSSVVAPLQVRSAGRVQSPLSLGMAVPLGLRVQDLYCAPGLTQPLTTDQQTCVDAAIGYANGLHPWPGPAGASSMPYSDHVGNWVAAFADYVATWCPGIWPPTPPAAVYTLARVIGESTGHAEVVRINGIDNVFTHWGDHITTWVNPGFSCHHFFPAKFLPELVMKPSVTHILTPGQFANIQFDRFRPTFTVPCRGVPSGPCIEFSDAAAMAIQNLLQLVEMSLGLPLPPGTPPDIFNAMSCSEFNAVVSRDPILGPILGGLPTADICELLLAIASSETGSGIPIIGPAHGPLAAGRSHFRWCRCSMPTITIPSGI